MKLRHFYALIGFLAQTLITGYCLVLPSSMEGVNVLTIAFVGTVAVASLTYYLGIRSVLRPSKPKT